MTATLQLPIEDRSQVADARRQAVNLGRRSGLGSDECGMLAIAVTELATNILKHAGGRGLLHVRPLPGDRGVEVIAVDRGPGIADAAASMRDGYSSTGTSGEGLGAVARAGSVFDLWSRSTGGTAMVVRVAAAQVAPPALPIDYSVISVPKPGEHACGDSFAVDGQLTTARVLMVDGLGHGPSAAQAAGAAVASFERHPGLDPVAAVEQIDRDLVGTRGGTVGVAAIDSAAQTLSYAGVGNISAVVMGEGGAQRLINQNGTAGTGSVHPRAVSCPFGPGSILVLHSDGISARWRPDSLDSLRSHHPALLAAVLMRDFGRGYDDASVVAAVPRAGR